MNDGGNSQCRVLDFAGPDRTPGFVCPTLPRSASVPVRSWAPRWPERHALWLSYLRFQLAWPGLSLAPRVEVAPAVPDVTSLYFTVQKERASRRPRPTKAQASLGPHGPGHKPTRIPPWLGGGLTLLGLADQGHPGTCCCSMGSGMEAGGSRGPKMAEFLQPCPLGQHPGRRGWEGPHTTAGVAHPNRAVSHLGPTSHPLNGLPSPQPRLPDTCLCIKGECGHWSRWFSLSDLLVPV